MFPVDEEASLRMIPGTSELNLIAFRDHVIKSILESLEEDLELKTKTSIVHDQLPKSRTTVPVDHRKDLVADGEEAPGCLAGKSPPEETDLSWSGVVTLEDHRNSSLG